MAFYGMTTTDKVKNDGKDSVWQMDEAELADYEAQKRESFNLSIKRLSAVLVDDDDLTCLVDGIHESGETLSKKEFEGLMRNVRAGKVTDICGFDLTVKVDKDGKKVPKFTTAEKVKIAKASYYLSWAMANLNECHEAQRVNEKDYYQIFEGKTYLDDYF